MVASMLSANASLSFALTVWAFGLGKSASQPSQLHGRIVPERYQILTAGDHDVKLKMKLRELADEGFLFRIDATPYGWFRFRHNCPDATETILDHSNEDGHNLGH